MAKIGTFTKNTDGIYMGTVKTLVLNAKLEIAPVEQNGEKAPGYRVYSDGSEVGAGWEKTSEQGTWYLSLKLDGPALPAAIYASLFKDQDADSEYSLLWQRPNSR
ncbi:MAG: DUF736 domain-containing protein [Rhodomicrobium sp.]